MSAIPGIEPTESELACAAAAGDGSAQRAVVERVLERVRATVRYLVADDPDAEDLVQLALIEILRSIGSFRGDSRLRTWADRITIRTVMHRMKRRRRRATLLRSHPEPLARPFADHAEEVEQREIQRRMVSLLQGLPPKRRLPVVLRLVHQYSIAEIAEMTDAPVNTVRDRLSKGRKELRKQVLRDSLLRDLIGGAA